MPSVFSAGSARVQGGQFRRGLRSVTGLSRWLPIAILCCSTGSRHHIETPWLVPSELAQKVGDHCLNDYRLARVANVAQRPANAPTPPTKINIPTCSTANFPCTCQILTDGCSHLQLHTREPRSPALVLLMEHGVIDHGYHIRPRWEQRVNIPCHSVSVQGPREPNICT